MSNFNLANEVYQEKQADVKELLIKLGMLVDEHGAMQEERPFCWDLVGDLAQVEVRLKEIAGFLRPVG